MGKRKHLDRVESLFERSPVVSFSSIERIVGKRKDSNYAKLLISNLIKRKKIMRLAKGYYTKHRDIGLSVFCFKPSYLGLQSALSHHGLWEQETIPIILTTNKVRTGIRKIDGSNILIRRLNKKYLFGFDYKKEGSFYLPYSDVEKTFIDMVFYRQKLTEETLKSIRQRINIPRLKSYLAKYPEKAARSVLRLLGSKGRSKELVS